MGAGGGAGAAEVVAADADAGYDEAGVAEPAVDGRFNTFHALTLRCVGMLRGYFPSSWEAKSFLKRDVGSVVRSR